MEDIKNKKDLSINIIGNILGIDGYSNHTKGLANAIYKINPDIKLDVPLQPGWEQQVTDAELKMIKNEHKNPDVTIMIATPPYWRIGMGDNCGKFVGFLVWEGDKIPKYWLEYLCDNRVDLIFVPSQHTKDAIYNTAEGMMEIDRLMKKVKIVPHGYDPKIFFPKELKKDDTFHFIVNKGWRGGMEDRGGIQFVLQAYTNEFKKDENIELLLKLNPSYINPQIVKQKIDELKLPKDAAKIKIACINTSQKEIAKLYNESDVCVCATRAEAFDLGTIEAMGTGLPVIVTGYGGQVEHMDKNCAWYIGYKLQKVVGDVLYEGIQWAVPEVKHLQKLMREAYSQRKLTKEKGIKAKEFASSWTWDNSAKKAMSFLNEL